MSKGTKQRTAAKRIVEQQKAAERRRTVTLWTSLGVVAVLVVAGLIGWGVLAGQDEETAAGAVPPTAVDSGTAFAVGDGPVKIDIYEDFLCPVCNQFEQSAATTIDTLIADKKVTVQYHPIAILDRASNGTQYSTRSAAASAAAAESGKFGEFHKLLFANQPAENSDGLTDAKLIELGTQAGITDAKFAAAVNDKTYWSWATKATEEASARGVTGTPTVMVGGQKLDNPSPANLEQAVGAAAE